MLFAKSRGPHNNYICQLFNNLLIIQPRHIRDEPLFVVRGGGWAEILILLFFFLAGGALAFFFSEVGMLTHFFLVITAASLFPFILPDPPTTHTIEFIPKHFKFHALQDFKNPIENITS